MSKQLTPDQFKGMREAEIERKKLTDKINIMWATGYRLKISERKHQYKTK